MTKVSSNSFNCFKNPGLGFIISLLDLANCKASCNLIFLYLIKYDNIIVDDLEIPLKLKYNSIYIPMN